jgi:hypothetical protein
MFNLPSRKVRGTRRTLSGEIWCLCVLGRHVRKFSVGGSAGAGFFATRDDVAQGGVGLVGISQGGWVAPLAATLAGAVSVIVLSAPSVTTIAVYLFFDRAARLSAATPRPCSAAML